MRDALGLPICLVRRFPHTQSTSTPVAHQFSFLFFFVRFSFAILSNTTCDDAWKYHNIFQGHFICERNVCERARSIWMANNIRQSTNDVWTVKYKHIAHTDDFHAQFEMENAWFDWKQTEWKQKKNTLRRIETPSHQFELILFFVTSHIH